MERTNFRILSQMKNISEYWKNHTFVTQDVLQEKVKEVMEDTNIKCKKFLSSFFSKKSIDPLIFFRSKTIKSDFSIGETYKTIGN